MGPILIASICMLASEPAQGRIDQASEIRIAAAWRGFSFRPPKDDAIRISRTRDGYTADGRRIDQRSVADLLAAVAEPPLERPIPENLGLSQQWLDQNAARGGEDVGPYFSKAAPNQQALYLASFKNADFIAKILPSLFSYWKTDDHPRVEVDIRGANGSTVSLVSESYYLFMLPWEVRAGGRSVKTYNARISRAVAGLVTAEFQERARLAADGLRLELAGRVRDEIKDEWDRLDVVNRAGSSLAKLESMFTVGSAAIHSYNSVDYGQVPEEGKPTETNLHARLRRADYPPGFSVGLVLPFEGGQVVDMDLFERGLGRYQQLALSVPWLRESMTDEPGLDVVLRLVRNRSLGDKAMGVFEQDMQALGKAPLAEKVKAQQSDTCLLLVGRPNLEGYWLVLPDGQMVLWRFQGHDSLIRWKPGDFTSGRCAAYRNRGVCVGAVISPTGQVVER